MANSEYLAQAIEPNLSISRLVRTVASSRTMIFTFGDEYKAESAAKRRLEAQSMSFWFLNAILAWIKDKGFQLSEPQTFEDLIQAMSMSMVSSSYCPTGLSSFFHSKRRESFLSYFYPLKPTVMRETIFLRKMSSLEF